MHLAFPYRLYLNIYTLIKSLLVGKGKAAMNKKRNNLKKVVKKTLNVMMNDCLGACGIIRFSQQEGYLIDAPFIIYMQLMRYPHVLSEFSLQMTSIKSITDIVFLI